MLSQLPCFVVQQNSMRRTYARACSGEKASVDRASRVRVEVVSQTSECLLEVLLQKSLPDVLNGLRAAGERVGHHAFGPLRPFSVGLQKNLSPPHLLAGAFKLPDRLVTLRPLIIGQSDDILLLQRIPTPWFEKTSR